MPGERGVTLTKAQRRALEHVAAHTGRLYGSRGDFPAAICRRDTLQRLISADLVEVPRLTKSHTWELTDLGRSALAKETDHG